MSDINQKTLAEKFFGLFSDIRRDEIRIGSLMMANIFLILTAYYFIKPVREGWLSVSAIQGLSKLEVKAYSALAQSLLLFAVLPLYAWLAAVWPRRTLINRVSIFFGCTLVIFWCLQPGLLAEQIPFSGVGFYLFVGIFSVTLVAQFWSFAADLYGKKRGKRLFPFVAVGASSGAALGAWIGKYLISTNTMDAFDLILLALLPLSISTLMANYCESRGASITNNDETETRRQEPAAPDAAGAYVLIRKHKYIAYTAVMVFLFSWVITSGDNILFAAVQDALQVEYAAYANDKTELDNLIKNATTAFYGDLYFWINLVGLFLQAFIVSRLLAFGGFGLLILATPLVSLASYIAMAVTPVVAVFKVMKIAELSSNYSINNTARNILWLPTSKAMIYQAKATVDTLVVRLGDAMAALTVMVGTRILSFSIMDFLFFNLILVAAWLVFAYLVWQENKKWGGEEPH